MSFLLSSFWLTTPAQLGVLEYIRIYYDYLSTGVYYWKVMDQCRRTRRPCFTLNKDVERYIQFPKSQLSSTIHPSTTWQIKYLFVQKEPCSTTEWINTILQQHEHAITFYSKGHSDFHSSWTWNPLCQGSMSAFGALSYSLVPRFGSCTSAGMRGREHPVKEKKKK